MNGRYLCAPDYPPIVGLPNTGQGLTPYFGSQQIGVWSMRDYHQASTWNVAVNGGDPNYANVQFVCNFQPDIRATTHYGPFYNDIGSGAQFVSGLTPMASSRQVMPGNGNYSLRCVTLIAHGALCSANAIAAWTIGGANDFDLECYFMPEGGPTGTLLDFRNGVNANLPTMYITGGTVHYLVNSVDKIVGTTAITAGVWHHMAVSRVSGNSRLFLDGTQEGATFVDATVYIAPVALGIGNAPGFGVASTNGHFAGARYTVGGTGRYAAGFTPTYRPFPTYQG